MYVIRHKIPGPVQTEQLYAHNNTHRYPSKVSRSNIQQNKNRTNYSLQTSHNWFCNFLFHKYPNVPPPILILLPRNSPDLYIQSLIPQHRRSSTTSLSNPEHPFACKQQHRHSFRISNSASVCEIPLYLSFSL